MNPCAPQDYFTYRGFWFDDWPLEPSLKVVALDPSKGRDSKAGDYSALVKLALDRHSVLYIEADLQRRPTPQMVADWTRACSSFPP